MRTCVSLDLYRRNKTYKIKRSFDRPINRSSSRWNLRTCLLKMAATPIKKCVFTYFIQQAIANTKLDYFTDWGRHRVRSLFCFKKKVILDFCSRRLGWVCTFWWDFNIISFFNAICGLLTKRANINTHQAWPFSGWHSFECPLQEHGTQGENSGPGYKRVYPGAHCCRMNTLVIRSW